MQPNSVRIFASPSLSLSVYKNNMINTDVVEYFMDPPHLGNLTKD